MKNNTEKQHLQIIAEKLRRVIAGEASDEAQEIIGEIIINLANESGFGVDDAAIIEFSFPLMIERVGIGYSRGVVHSLNAVFDSCLPEVEQVDADALDAEVIQ
jgi:hypothetical protein